MKQIKHTLFACLFLGMSYQASAIGRIVFDPTSYANNILQYVKMGQSYAQQVKEYQKQVQQFDLQRVAGQVANTSNFKSTLANTNTYKNAFDINKSNTSLSSLSGFSSFKAPSVPLSPDQFLSKLGAATDRKLTISKEQGALAQQRFASVTADKANITALQNSNATATGAMQAAQVGNQINSEMVSQVVKMREENAMEAQAKAEKEALDEAKQAEAEARLKQLRATDKQALVDSKNRRHVSGALKGLK